MTSPHTRTRTRPQSQSQSPKIPPFLRQASADVVLLSSDKPAVELRVHRRILVEASELFRTMFDLPQPAPALPTTNGSTGGARVDSAGQGEAELPRIEMQEPSSVLIPLLTLLYPVPPPFFPTLELLPGLLRASHKYDLPLPLSHLRSTLTEPRFLHSDPLAVYALACQFDLHEEARLASRYTLKVELMSLLLPLPDKLGQMLAVDLVQLVALRVARAEQAKHIIKSPSAFSTLRCSCGHLPPWVQEWRRRACAELDRFPVGETVFGSGFLGDVLGCCAAGVGCGKCAAAGWDREEWERLRAEVDGLPDTI